MTRQKNFHTLSLRKDGHDHENWIPNLKTKSLVHEYREEGDDCEEAGRSVVYFFVYMPVFVTNEHIVACESERNAYLVLCAE